MFNCYLNENVLDLHSEIKNNKTEQREFNEGVAFKGLKTIETLNLY